MHLSPEQIRTACRAHGACDDASLDDLLGAMCRRLALVPDVRAGVVADARARLLVTGPPSAEVLADMLVGELHHACAG